MTIITNISKQYTHSLSYTHTHTLTLRLTLVDKLLNGLEAVFFVVSFCFVFFSLVRSAVFSLGIVETVSVS